MQNKEAVNLKTRTWRQIWLEKKEKEEKAWRKPLWIVGYHKAKQHLHYWYPRKKREEGIEKLFNKTVAENIPNVGKEKDI